jgi:hypothetical protein
MSAAKYPWDKWFRRRRLKLEWGVHYDCMPHCMAVQVRNAARARGVSVSIKTTVDGTLFVTMVT